MLLLLPLLFINLAAIRVAADCACPVSQYTGMYGLIYSPNYPQPYCPNQNCSYHISVPAGFAVLLQFLELNTYPQDVVDVFDGLSNDPTAQLASVFGTLHSNNSVLYSGGSSMLLQFRSNQDASVGYGWSAYYMAVAKEAMCGRQVFSAREGSFSSPNWPNNYPNNVQCKWNIILSAGQTIYLNFQRAKTQSDNDFVIISEAGVVVKHSGTDFPSYRSSGNNLTVSFVSDGSGVASGFKASFGAGPPPRHCFADVGFMFENSQLVGSVEFDWTKDAIGRMVDNLKWGWNEDYIGLGYFSSSSKSRIVLKPRTYSSSQVRSVLHNVTWEPAGLANLEMGLELAEAMFSEVVGRNQTPDFRFLMLFAQGFYDGTPPFDQAKKLREKWNVTILAVALSPKTDYSNLLQIVGGDSSKIFSAANYTLAMTQLQRTLGEATCGPLPPPCDPNPCANQGTCVVDLEYKEGFYCQCVRPYFGRLCNQDACKICDTLVPGECGPGTCVARKDCGGFKCVCPPNCSGELCQTCSLHNL